ncbi:MAG: flagellin/flagellar hook associated protein, partial [Paenibacillaceae bacterium]|nr:flagellin/flagellar hook associated protein [Paenibacillaceae bacterium]
MRINHNITALNNHRNMGINNNATGKNMEKLSSGLRINRAGDDAAGLAVSEKMRGQIRGLEMAQRNVQDGISFVQTAEGAMNEVSAMLTRMKELNVQRSTGTYQTQDRQNVGEELTALNTQIQKIMSDTKFNGINITSAVTVQSDDASQAIGITAITVASFNAMTVTNTGAAADGTTDLATV